jgi:hypothetical protein
MLGIFFRSKVELLLADDGLEFSTSNIPPLLPPRMADTEDWPSLPCFRIAEVMVTHSVVMRATGFMVIGMVTGSDNTPGRPLLDRCGGTGSDSASCPEDCKEDSEAGDKGILGI